MGVRPGTASAEPGGTSTAGPATAGRRRGGRGHGPGLEQRSADACDRDRADGQRAATDQEPPAIPVGHGRGGARRTRIPGDRVDGRSGHGLRPSRGDADHVRHGAGSHRRVDRGASLGARSGDSARTTRVRGAPQRSGRRQQQSERDERGADGKHHGHDAPAPAAPAADRSAAISPTSPATTKPAAARPKERRPTTPRRPATNAAPRHDQHVHHELVRVSEQVDHQLLGAGRLQVDDEVSDRDHERGAAGHESREQLRDRDRDERRDGAGGERGEVGAARGG